MEKSQLLPKMLGLFNFPVGSDSSNQSLDNQFIFFAFFNYLVLSEKSEILNVILTIYENPSSKCITTVMKFLKLKEKFTIFIEDFKDRSIKNYVYEDIKYCFNQMQSRNVSETADLIIKQFSSILIPFSCFIKKLGEEYLGVEGFSDLLYRNRNIELLIDYKLKKGSYPPIPLCCKLYRLIYGSGMNPFQPDFPIKHPEYCLKTFLEFSVEVLNRKYTVDQLRKYEDVKINNSIHVKQSTRNKRQVSESSSGKSTDGYHTAGQHRSNQLAIHNSKYTQKLQKKSNSAKESCDGYTTKDLITDDDEMSRAHNTTENVSYDALDLLQRGEKKISSYEISESQSHNPTSMVDTKSDSMKMYIPDNISFATIEGIRKKSSLVVVNKTLDASQLKTCGNSLNGPTHQLVINGASASRTRRIRNQSRGSEILLDGSQEHRIFNSIEINKVKLLKNRHVIENYNNRRRNMSNAKRRESKLCPSINYE